MNCQDFETVIVEIARARLMDAVARERGLAHAETCAHCAALLAEERALSGRLHALSAEARAEKIPEQIETALLAAFRQRAAVPVARPIVPNKRRRLLAVAALILLSFGLSLAGWVAMSPSPTTTAGGSASKLSVPNPPSVAETPGKSEQLGPQTARFNVEAKMERHPRRLLRAVDYQPLADDGQPRELVSEFFPVLQGSELIPLEGGQLVRVRMPRSNLIPLGIHFNQERADETIQADVLVSNDGLARAIRLVY
jgi:hypothetical protein